MSPILRRMTPRLVMGKCFTGRGPTAPARCRSPSTRAAPRWRSRLRSFGRCRGAGGGHDGYRPAQVRRRRAEQPFGYAVLALQGVAEVAGGVVRLSVGLAQRGLLVVTDPLTQWAPGGERAAGGQVDQ